MSEQSARRSSFDKNLRSFLEAVSMLEREGVALLDRVGVDREVVRRGFEVVGSVSSDIVRQIAGSLGLADAKSVDALSREVRGLLERVARLREQQRDARTRLEARVDRIERSKARLDGAVEMLARVQGRTQARLAALETRSASLESRLALRGGQVELLEGLRGRIEKLEGVVATLTGEVRASKAGARKGSSTPRRAPARTSEAATAMREERMEPVTAKPVSR